MFHSVARPSCRAALLALAAGVWTVPAQARQAETADSQPLPLVPAGSSTTASQQGEVQPDFGLTGDWGGLRTDLDDIGIDVNASIWSEVASNVSGGDRKATTQVSGWAVALDFDTEKLMGLDGGHFEVSFTKRQGPDINAVAGLHMLLSPQEEYSRGQTYRLTDFWYRQQLGPISDIKVGRIPMGEDFAALPCEFMNVNFCANQIGPLVGDYWYNSPLAPWAARVQVKPGDLNFKLGVFQSNPGDEREDFFLYHKGANGVTVPFEAGWTPKVGGLPGSYRIGGWYNSAKSEDVLTGTDGRPFAVTGLDPESKRGRYGGYVLIQQQLTGTYVDGPKGPQTTKGLTAYFNFTQTDRRTARKDNQTALWLTYTAPFESRPHDKIGLALSRMNVNSRAARSEVLADPGSTMAHAEYDTELYYAFEVLPHFVLSPNVQYIVHPGGYADIGDITVLGLKTMLTL